MKFLERLNDLVKPARKVFISYDTREIAWADFMKDTIEARVARCTAFVARRDIRPGEHPLKRMLEQELRVADAVVAICSRLSRTSPWLWWESSAAWSRHKLLLPLFLDVGATEFGPPISVVTQGQPFDLAGVEITMQRLVRELNSQGRSVGLFPAEIARLRHLEAARDTSPLGLDVDGPSCTYEEPGLSYRRARVTNGSGRTVRGVQVQLVSFVPQGAPFLPVRLERMHRLEQPFDLNSGDEAYIDVVAWPHGGQEFCLTYCQPERPLPNGIARGRYTLTVRVTGTDIAALEKQLVLDVDATGAPTLTE